MIISHGASARPPGDPDRPQVLSFLRDPRAIDSPGAHVRVVEEAGEVVGVAVGVVPDAGEEACLGPILLNDGRRWDHFHVLIAALVEKAIALGFAVGTSDTRSRRIVRHLEQTFGLVGEPSAWEPNSGRAVQWSYRVHLPTFLKQLRSVM